MATKHPTRKTYLTKHHMIPKQRGGHLAPWNTLRIWRDKHDCWHFCFGQLTLDEIIDKLFARNKIIMQTSRTKYWKFMFKDKSVRKVIALLKRIRKIKRSLKKKKHGNNV